MLSRIYPCPAPGGVCAAANQKRPCADRVDDVGLTTLIMGKWGPNTKRVVCAACGSYVRWGKVDRTPEEAAARDESNREYRRAYYIKMGWNLRDEDRDPAPA
jgi:hypothetical protein